jgi:hypothetical protein
MCGESSMVHKRRFESRRGPWERHSKSGSFFGLETDEMGPWAQVVAALSVLAPVALSGLFLVVFVPGLWWIFTTYFWVAFPAFGLLVRGVAGLSEGRPVRVSGESRERELLKTLSKQGEISAAAVAAETSLTVAEADRMLMELAEGGHLEVRVRGGGMFYALWEAEGHPEDGAIGRRSVERNELQDRARDDFGKGAA